MQGNNSIKELCHICIPLQCLLWCGLTSFSTLALDFVSSVGLQAYNNRRKGQRSLFVFHFQVGGSVFPMCTKVNDYRTFTLCTERVFSDVLEGVVLKRFFWELAPDPHLSPASLPQ